MDKDPALPVTPKSDRHYPARPLLAASIAVFRDHRVLLTQRVGAPYAGRFSLPGGLVEPGETLEAAALRELLEEVGVDARVLGFNRHVEVIDHDAAGAVRHHYVIASFVATWIAGEAMSGPEAADVVWADRLLASALPTTEHLPALLDAAWAMADDDGCARRGQAS